MSNGIWATSDLAWAAGFLDGEGYFGIREQKGHLYITISAAQVDPRPLLKLQQLFGGNFRLAPRPADSNTRDIYAYNITTRAAAHMLQAIRPYLVVKDAQADLLLQFQATVGVRGVPVALEDLRTRVLLKDGIDQMNRRGRD